MKNNPVPFSETSLGDSLVLSVNDTILQTSSVVEPAGTTFLFAGNVQSVPALFTITAQQTTGTTKIG